MLSSLFVVLTEREVCMLANETEALLSKIEKDFLTSPFAEMIGVNVKEFTEGEVTLKVPVQKHQYNTMGTVHGGVYATLLDIAMGMAIRSIVKVPSVTVNLGVNYMSGVSEGALIVKGTVVNQGYRLVVANAAVYSQDDVLLANASGTFKVLRKKES